MSEWKELKTIGQVAEAHEAGMEIEVNHDCHIGWQSWAGTVWYSSAKYHARPRKPKMVKVKSLCWRQESSGGLLWRCEGYDIGENWKRFPKGDIEGEVEA
jgi:hypothetical protein